MAPADDRTGPYGTWPSPVSPAMVASAGLEFGHVALDGGDVYWREQRPEEDGRGVIVRPAAGGHEDCTPDACDVRTLVHEYGGGDFAVQDGVVFFANHEDQRVYRQDIDDRPTPITPEPETERGLRYADFELTRDGRALYCVRENHDAARDDAEQPVTELVRLPADGASPPTVVASGHDFYASPGLAPAGDRLAWLTWDHPRMPWDGTELHVATVTDDGTLSATRTVMGGPEESVFQPAWRSDGTLHAVSDRTGWWNLYRRTDGEWEPYREEPAEYGFPQWQFGYATYAFLDDGTVVALVTRQGEQAFELLGPDGSREVPEQPAEVYWPRLRSAGESVVVPAGGPATPQRLIRWTPGAEPVTLRQATELELDPSELSRPEHVVVPTRDGAEAYAYYYPPANPTIEPPAGERPPLVVVAHGGPTGRSQPNLSLAVQCFTSRGIAVADVNYRGSSGYGRAFREALAGEWGRVDVTDCIDAASHLAEAGRVDPDRLVVRGGSAGGFVALCALAFHDAFAAGTSYYGVADLERLWELIHKFESRYLDGLVGPYPEAADTYRDRSPVHRADAIEAPVLLLQGAEDPVVPLSQAEAMVEGLAANGVPHALHVFEGEEHGFRREASTARALELELAFYGEVLGFDPADEVGGVELSPGGGAQTVGADAKHDEESEP